MIDLDAIEARASAASPGPWSVTNSYDHEINVDVCDADGNLVGAKDEDFIAAAREDVPALVAEVRRLQKQSADLAKLARGGVRRCGWDSCSRIATKFHTCGGSNCDEHADRPCMCSAGPDVDVANASIIRRLTKAGVLP